MDSPVTLIFGCTLCINVCHSTGYSLLIDDMEMIIQYMKLYLARYYC